MADLLPMLALFAAAVAWFLLPLLPALRELLRPTDLAALKVVDRSSGYVAYFARNFRNYLEKQTALLPAEQQVGDFLGRLPDGTRLVRIHKAVTTLEREGKDGPEKRLVVVDVPLRLEGGETFLMELYARAPLTGGPEAVYRAVYAEKDLTLGEGSTVLRWAHAGGRLAVGRDSVLRGRISSDTGVELGPGVVFERIGAPIISAGNHGLFEPPPPPPAPPPAWRLPDGATRVGDHVRIAGDLAIPPGLRVAATLVVAGRLTIGLGTIVEGSVKAHGDIVLEDEVQVSSAVVTRTRLVVGRGAWIGGPAIAETSIRLRRGALVGGPELAATLSAPVVELESGAAVYGQISAPNGAWTL